MVALLLALTLSAAPASHAQCPGPRHRSAAAKLAFVRTHPCPGGPDKGRPGLRCQGWVITHTCPMECCGVDSPRNLRWRTLVAAVEERRKNSCKPCTPANRRG